MVWAFENMTSNLGAPLQGTPNPSTRGLCRRAFANEGAIGGRSWQYANAVHLSTPSCPAPLTLCMLSKTIAQTPNLAPGPLGHGNVKIAYRLTIACGKSWAWLGFGFPVYPAPAPPNPHPCPPLFVLMCVTTWWGIICKLQYTYNFSTIWAPYLFLFVWPPGEESYVTYNTNATFEQSGPPICSYLCDILVRDHM